MSGTCGGEKPHGDPADPCRPPSPCGAASAPPLCGSGGDVASGPRARFARMIENAIAFAKEAKAAGRPVVGIMCEFTPREIIMAAGAVPVCLCGGSAEMALAAEEELPANLCPLIKSTYGYHATRSNPLLELADLVVAETTCDGKKKMYEVMGRTRPMLVLELPQKPLEEDAFLHWRAELMRLCRELEARFHAAITDEALRDAVRRMNRERDLRRRLARLLAAERPLLSGRQILDLKSLISCVPCDLLAYEQILQECSGRQAPQGAARRPRVLLTGVPHVHGAERVVDLIERAGGLVVCQENCTGLKPLLEDVAEDAADPLDAIAQKYFHLPCSVMTRNTRRFDSLRELAREFSVDCVIEVVWQACLTYDVEAVLIKEFVERELRLPYLKIVTDYSPSDSARITVRVEALFETLAARARL
ncbi:MAG: 2-hydroxyacyl-CoA dehydratase [Planctomycetes bacterium]|nr:2-hydroxyacyl-CoA dehydratase [Planctomycetota bacterium]